MQIKDLGVKAGVVLNPATPIESIQHVLTQVDLILLMSGKPLSQYPSFPCILSSPGLAQALHAELNALAFIAAALGYNRWY